MPGSGSTSSSTPAITTVTPGRCTCSTTSRVASTVCRGDVPVSTTAVRTYEVEGLDQWDGQPALRVRRTSELLLTGQRGGRRPATVSGTGGGTQRLFFDLAGRLLGATGESTADVRMTAGEESGELKQRVKTRVALVAQR